MSGRISVDVAIIGGGLVGSSAALALRGMGFSVALLDKGFCGAQASGVNYGGVRRQGRPVEQLPLAARASAVWVRLRGLIGIDGEYQRSGHLKLAQTEADMSALEAYAETVAGYGLDLQLLSAGGLRQRFPWIGDGLAGASFCPSDGHANPRLVAAGFPAAARRAGVQVFEQTPVIGVTRQAEGFALETETGPSVRAGTVINAAGAWAAPFAASFGEALPLKRIYPSMIVTEPLPPLMDVNIGMEGGGIYARQVERGNCIVGGERGQALPDPDFSRPRSAGALAIMNRAAEIFPALKHAHAIRFWTGTEGATPDKNPIIGPSTTTPGLIHAFGFTGAGFQIAPGVGEVLADLVRDGRTQTPIHAFSPARFLARRAAASLATNGQAQDQQNDQKSEQREGFAS
ncbi:FAD-dependent oxidoreductase [Elstera litoralis]|uniref:FAD-dependent oxidoreductase n=2 Tax=Elstera litoralis TaxID=552518 RepID=A0A0F3ISS7_9PROT|nr:FAD-dependent oxidoreductase [Elstera litoralis]